MLIENFSAKATVAKKGVTWFTLSGKGPLFQETFDGRTVVGVAGGATGSWSHGIHSQAADRDEGWYSASFLLFHFIRISIPKPL